MSRPAPAPPTEIPPPPWHGGNLAPSAEQVYDWVHALPRHLALRVVEEHLARNARGLRCYEMRHEQQIQSLSDRLRMAVMQRDDAHRVLDEGRDVRRVPIVITQRRTAVIKFELAVIKLATRVIDRTADRIGVHAR